MLIMGVKYLLIRKKKPDSLLTDTISGSREIRIVVKCVLSVIFLIVNKYKEYSLRFIIVLIIDLTDNMWLLLHNNEFKFNLKCDLTWM